MWNTFSFDVDFSWMATSNLNIVNSYGASELLKVCESNTIECECECVGHGCKIFFEVV